METATRALPYADLQALLGVVVVIDGSLVGGDLPPDLTQRLIRRLSEHGPLVAGATAGTLNAALSDLAQRLHWAMGPGGEYPPPMPHRTNYLLDIPRESVAACVQALRQAGGTDIEVRPSTSTGWEMRPTGPNGFGEQHATDVLDGQTVTVAFSELAPDPAYQDRITQLGALAEQHGGRYQGAGW
jgi:hypothetical protein